MVPGEGVGYTDGADGEGVTGVRRNVTLRWTDMHGGREGGRARSKQSDITFPCVSGGGGGDGRSGGQ